MENVGGGQNGINGNFSWDFREVWANPNTHNNTTTTPTTTTTTTTNNNNHPPFFFSHQFNHSHHAQSMYMGGHGQGGGVHVHPDPHLTCLKLGKRHYFEDGNGGTGFDIPGLGVRHVDHQDFRKRGRSYEYGGPSSSSTITTTVVGLGTTGAVPRCQVEGCHVALLNAKDYHRRHKVCEMHSKSPKVIVLGTEQRFCQQCSRFHAVSEFDDSKRSCRRRLAGHNERRRKNTNDSISRNLTQDHRSMNGRLPSMSSSTGRALSLLSSKTTSWVSPSDLSSRSSAALRELIAENRAAVLARQLFLDQGWHHHHAMDDLMSGVTTQPVHVNHHHHPMFSEPSEWERFHEAGAHVTLDLMQDSGSPFGFLSGRNTSKEEEEEEECREIWKSLEGTHVV